MKIESRPMPYQHDALTLLVSHMGYKYCEFTLVKRTMFADMCDYGV